MDYWLGIDCGGTFLKAGIYDSQGHEYATRRQTVELFSPQPGWAERDMDQLWQTTLSVIRQLLAGSPVPPHGIKGIGISAQGKGLFLLDKQGQPLGNGILSSDRRALSIVQQWQQQGVPQQLYPVTRQTLWTGHPVALLRWIKDNQPQRYHEIGTILMSHDYLRYKLTGQLGCEITNISESNLYDMQQGGYSSLLAEQLGIAEAIAWLPPIVGSSQVVGQIGDEVAKQSGLSAGTPVVGGLFDVVATALCAGLYDETRLNAVMGTWSVTSGITKQMIDHSPASPLDYPYVYGRHAQAGRYIVHDASPTSAANLEWIRQQWGESIDYATINHAVAGLPKAATSIFFLPFLYGSNAGLNMTAGFYGLQGLHQREHLLQAVYEGVIFSHMTHLTRMLKRFPLVKTLSVTGGPTRSKVWMQMLADVSGLNVELVQIDETGCLGAALAAAIGAGAHKDFIAAQQSLSRDLMTLVPDPDAFAPYQKKYQHYQLLVAALNEFSNKLAR